VVGMGTAVEVLAGVLDTEVDLEVGGQTAIVVGEDLGIVVPVTQHMERRDEGLSDRY